jgi:hypothetical protein
MASFYFVCSSDPTTPTAQINVFLRSFLFGISPTNSPSCAGAGIPQNSATMVFPMSEAFAPLQGWIAKNEVLEQGALQEKLYTFNAAGDIERTDDFVWRFRDVRLTNLTVTGMNGPSDWSINAGDESEVPGTASVQATFNFSSISFVSSHT